MSFYIKSPFKPTPKLLVEGTPEYAFGSWNADVAPTQGNVLSNSAVTTTGTVTLQILSGNVPKPDSLLTIVGTSNSAGIFNVTNAPILTVSAATNPDMGIYTVTFTISSTSQGVLADAGQFYIAVPEIGDQLTSGLITSGVSSAPVVSPVSPPNSVGKSISATVKLPANTAANPSTLSAITVVIQGANLDYDTEYVTIGTIVTAGSAGNVYEWQSGQAVGAVAPGSVGSGSVNLPNFRFLRLQVSTGGSGTGPIIGKIME